MKIWPDKIELPKKGICEVRELEDDEADNLHPPANHGFVNLYKNGEYVGWCGKFYAQRHYMDKQKRKVHILLDKGYVLVENKLNPNVPILKKDDKLFTVRKSGAVASIS